MKILHVVTLVTPDNAYGGPLRVALNQTRQLREMGHDVTLVAGARGFRKPFPAAIDGVPVWLFKAFQVIPGTGFAGVSSPALLLAILRLAPQMDVIHIHLARDLVVAPAAMIARLVGTKYVLQTHGMIDESSRALAKIFDAVLIRPGVKGARAVFWLTHVERRSLSHLFGGIAHLARVQNGVPIEPNRVEGLGNSEPGDPLVLFMARLHARKRPMAFVRSAFRLRESGAKAKFVMYGPDEGEGDIVSEEISSDPNLISWFGGISPDKTRKVMAEADVYCLPPVDEPFPMAVLEAFSAGLPVVVTDSCGLAEYVHKYRAGFVVGAEEEELTDALKILIDNRELRQEMGHNARGLAIELFSIQGVCKQLIGFYNS